MGTRKDREEERELQGEADEPPKRHKTGREGESLEERRLRQAAEREELLRQMEAEEAGGSSETKARSLSPHPEAATSVLLT